jgi:hypothetical protein
VFALNVRELHTYAKGFLTGGITIADEALLATQFPRALEEASLSVPPEIPGDHNVENLRTFKYWV